MHYKTSALGLGIKNFLQNENRIALVIGGVVLLVFAAAKLMPTQARYNEEVDVPVKINRAPLLLDSYNCTWIVQETQNGPKLAELKPGCNSAKSQNLQF